MGVGPLPFQGGDRVEEEPRVRCPGPPDSSRFQFPFAGAGIMDWTAAAGTVLSLLTRGYESCAPERLLQNILFVKNGYNLEFQRS